MPYKKALELGFNEEEILVILTRKKGYRKKEESYWIKKIYESYYKDPKYKLLVKAIENRYLLYNHILDDLEAMHKGIDIIYPPDDFHVKRLSKYDKVILEGFEQGVNAGREFLLY